MDAGCWIRRVFGAGWWEGGEFCGSEAVHLGPGGRPIHPPDEPYCLKAVFGFLGMGLR